jgi:large subunit ribosomal protein L3
MPNEKPGLLAIKVGMTQIFNNDNKVVPVTVLDLSGNTVVRVKTKESKDGYSAVQLGLGEQKEERLTKPESGHFKKAEVSAKRFLREVRVSDADLAKYEVGTDVAVSTIFSAGQKIDVTGTSKGRGFAGVMKRHNFAGFISSHGTHEFFRHGGSIGTRLTPGHVLKGKKMPGHMGAERVTIQSLTVVEIDAERNLLYVKGGVPGPNGGLLLVRDAVK